MHKTMSADMLSNMFASKETLSSEGKEADHLQNEPDIGESPQRQKEESQEGAAEGDNSSLALPNQDKK